MNEIVKQYRGFFCTKFSEIPFKTFDLDAVTDDKARQDFDDIRRGLEIEKGWSVRFYFSEISLDTIVSPKRPARRRRRW
jgi:hypothetical protein